MKITQISMTPVIGIVGILASATIVINHISSSWWLIALVTILFSLCVTMAIALYVYLAIKFPENLR